MARHYPDLGSASDWREIFFNQSKLLPRSGYGISARVYRAISTRTWRFFKLHIFYPDSLKPLWRAVSKQCGFGVRIHWFRVDGRPIRAKRCAVSKMSRRIQVEVASGIILRSNQWWRCKMSAVFLGYSSTCSMKIHIY